MYTNDLNSAYVYENERRIDERRAAAECQRTRGLGKKGGFGFLSPAMKIGILAILVIALRVI